MPSKSQKGILLAATTGNFVGATSALYAVFGLVLIPISTEFGWPRAKVSGVLAIVALLGGLMNFVIGPLLDRFGARRLALIGTLGCGIALMAFTFTPANLPVFYGLFTLAGFAAAFSSSMVFSKLVSGWFDRGRGTALGFTGGVGNGAGSALLPLLAGTIISHWGWRAGYRGVALVVLLGLPVLLRYLRDPPTKPSTAVTPDVAGLRVGEAMRTRMFWLLLVTVGACAAGLTAMFGQVVPVLAEQGVDAGRAVSVVGVFSLVCAFWQLGMGYLLDRTGTPWIMAPFYLLAMAGIWLLHHVQSEPLLLLAGAMMGLGLGTEFGAMPLLISRYFGLRSYGAIAGIMYAVVQLAQGLVPLAMNSAYDRLGTYVPALQVLQLVIVVAAVLLCLLPRLSASAAASAPQRHMPLRTSVLAKSATRMR